jgi:hypothetical protein
LGLGLASTTPNRQPLNFYFFKKKKIMGAFWEKKKEIRMVELQEFESLERLSVTFETLEVKE